MELLNLHNPCRVERFAPSYVYVLLPNKTDKTYNRMIEVLSEETNPRPGKKLADFEKAALNVFSQKFSHAELSCCFFHLTQFFNRKINEIGLKTYYENFPEFNLAPRMLPALSHVPPAHVKASFELVIEEITDVIERQQFEESVVEKMDELVKYFKSTYIKNSIVIRKPPIPIEMWNGTWKKIRKCKSLNMFKNPPRLDFFSMFSFFL